MVLLLGLSCQHAKWEKATSCSFIVLVTRVIPRLPKIVGMTTLLLRPCTQMVLQKIMHLLLAKLCVSVDICVVNLWENGVVLRSFAYVDFYFFQVRRCYLNFNCYCFKCFFQYYKTKSHLFCSTVFSIETLPHFNLPHSNRAWTSFISNKQL